ncbi:hypothetical protein vseg_009126 [Gypsophila vaccaria]
MTGRGEKCPTIGIDLGTTYSCVAVSRNGQVEIFLNDQGNRTTPSWVAFTDSERFVGEAAVNQAARNPLNTIYDAKRLIGRRFSDDSVQEDMKLWPFEVIDGTDSGKADRPMFVVEYMGKTKNFLPEEISAMMLAKMKAVAEAVLGGTVKNAVVTVPAYFNDSQRRATKDAAIIAGLNVVAIINEPTAAAMAYNHETMTVANKNAAKQNVLVFDLGGGTLDVSLVEMKKGEIKVKAVSGDTHLGGGDFDSNVVNYLLDDFKRKFRKDISDQPRVLSRLRSATERAKRTLSSVTETSIELDCLYDGIDFTSKLTRARFENLNLMLFKSCIDTVDKCLKDAKMTVSDVDDVVLVGGSTRIPKVQQMLQEFFDGKPLCKTLCPDEAVAYGAAVHAASLTHVSSGRNDGSNSSNSSNNREIVLVDVTPLSLGVANYDGKSHVIIPRNTTIPVKKSKIRETSHDDQTSVNFEVYEGECVIAEDNNFLDNFHISGFPPAPKGHTKFEVCFEIDADGILNVSAVELGTGLRKEITITNHRGRLSKREIKRMIVDAEKYKAQDEKQMNLMVAKNALENYANNVWDSLNDVGNIRNNAKSRKIKAVVENTLDWLEQDSDGFEISELEEKLRELQNMKPCFLIKGHE